MMTSTRVPERNDAPKSAAIGPFANLSIEDIRRCLEATGTALRVAKDRGDDRLVAELRARYQGLTDALNR